MDGTRDDRLTLLAAGLLAYVGETMLHEAGGHGGVCLAQGHQVTMLAPLWMRCSVVAPAMVAAGPAANAIGALAAWVWLRWAPPRGTVAPLLLWLSLAFNALVACGYLFVGAAAGFGDWPVLFAGVAPGWVWRVPAAALAAGGYYGGLRLLAALFRRVAGAGPGAGARLRQWGLWPGTGAALVAVLAEVAGGRAEAGPIGLALGCTLVVGWSVTAMDGAVARPGPGTCDRGRVGRSVWVIAAALVVGLAFVLGIGPGLAISGA